MRKIVGVSGELHPAVYLYISKNSVYSVNSMNIRLSADLSLIKICLKSREHSSNFVIQILINVDYKLCQL